LMMSQSRGFDYCTLYGQKSRELKIEMQTTAKAVCCWAEKSVEFRPNQPTSGNLRPISTGSFELRGAEEAVSRTCMRARDSFSKM
jgi:hypothetical protein